MSCGGRASMESVAKFVGSDNQQVQIVGSVIRDGRRRVVGGTRPSLSLLLTYESIAVDGSRPTTRSCRSRLGCPDEMAALLGILAAPVERNDRLYTTHVTRLRGDVAGARWGSGLRIRGALAPSPSQERKAKGPRMAERSDPWKKLNWPSTTTTRPY